MENTTFFIVTTLPLILSGIFFILSAIHFNWALGGDFGFEKSLPTKKNGERLLNPTRIDSAVVGAGLLAFALLYGYKSGITYSSLPMWIMELGKWLIPSIFLLRAMGDFKHIGFFKKVRNTEFGKMDTLFYSPLCLIIAISGFLIAVMV